MYHYEHRLLITVCVGAAFLAGWIAGQAGRTPQADTQGQTTGRAEMELSPSQVLARIGAEYEIVDLTVTISENLPAIYPNASFFQRWTFNWFAPIKGPLGEALVPSAGAWYGQRYVLDEHTGTQIDFPPHFIPPPGSGLPHAADAGLLTGDRYPLERLMGPTAVVDVRHLLNKSSPGTSPRITVEIIRQWEQDHGEIKPGDVVLFYSGYSDLYYKPFPDGNRMSYQPLIEKSEPGWPAPTPEVMEYLHRKGVWHLGLDGTSMGPVDNGGPTHIAGLKYGMSWTELLTNLGQLPSRGAYYMTLPIKVVDQSGSSTRSIAIKRRGEKGLAD